MPSISPQQRKRRAGSTLHEMLVSLAIMGILGSGMLGVILTTWNAYEFNQTSNERMQNTYRAMYTIVNGGGVEIWALKQAEFSTLNIVESLNGDWQATYEATYLTNSQAMVMTYDASTGIISNDLAGILAENVTFSEFKRLDDTAQASLKILVGDTDTNLAAKTVVTLRN